MDQQTLRQIAGNEAADEAAKVAATTLHPEFPASTDKEARNTHKQLTWVAATIAAVLPLWPIATREPRQRTSTDKRRRKPMPGAKWHTWVEEIGAARCSSCLLVSLEQDKESSPMVGCRPMHHAMRSVLADLAGHRLSTAEVADKKDGTCSTIVFCVACGAYAKRKPILLKQRCPGQASQNAGAICLEKIRRGVPPWLGLSDATAVLPRAPRDARAIPPVTEPRLAQTSIAGQASERFAALLARVRARL